MFYCDVQSTYVMRTILTANNQIVENCFRNVSICGNINQYSLTITFVWQILKSNNSKAQFLSLTIYY